MNKYWRKKFMKNSNFSNNYSKNYTHLPVFQCKKEGTMLIPSLLTFICRPYPLNIDSRITLSLSSTENSSPWGYCLLKYSSLPVNLMTVLQSLKSQTASDGGLESAVHVGVQVSHTECAVESSDPFAGLQALRTRDSAGMADAGVISQSFQQSAVFLCIRPYSLLPLYVALLPIPDDDTVVSFVTLALNSRRASRSQCFVRLRSLIAIVYCCTASK
jgi:hypothetical protein